MENIGIITGEDLNIKLLDFGHAIQIAEVNSISTSKLRGSRHYTAPEIIDHYFIKTDEIFAIDYWEIGIVCYSLLMKMFPFETYHDILHSKQLWNDTIDVHCKRFVDGLLVKSPSERKRYDDIDLDLSSFIQYTHA